MLSTNSTRVNQVRGHDWTYLDSVLIDFFFQWLKHSARNIGNEQPDHLNECLSSGIRNDYVTLQVREVYIHMVITDSLQN